MKEIMKKIFSFSEAETNMVHEENAKVIELVNCPLKEMMCNVHLTEVKRNYIKSEESRKSKDFQSSISSLKNAFFKTTELMSHPCSKCANQYRVKVVDAMVNIHDELEDISQGLFGNKNYQKSYNIAKSVLKEFKNEKYPYVAKLEDPKDKFLGNYLN